jgi:hypothetical protein
MQRIIAIAWIIAAVPVAFAQPATDKAQARLTQILTPRAEFSLTYTTAPVIWPSAATLMIDTPSKPIVVQIVRLPRMPVKASQPRPAAEAVPLVAFQDKTAKPKDVELPTKPLLRLPSVDTTTPLPIPILARPHPDRVSLGDPAMEASLRAALKPLSPSRDQPVPFAAVNIPDPFEHARAGQLRNPPEESSMPPAIPLQKPK